jgi:serine/threonine protein kinase
MSDLAHEDNQLKSLEKSVVQPDPQDVLPRRFGRLTLLRRVARGGMGEVYLASTRGIEGAERAVVVKKIRREHHNDKSFRARFLDETRIQAQLQHPGIAQILEAATDEEECPYAVVEYVEGRHLGEVLARSNQLGVSLSWPDAVAIGVSFADALAHVHECKDPSGRPLEIAHRDLSPQNVMVGYGGDVKLIDFGTARGENRRCRTVSGIVYAKPGYVAPEVANQTPGGAPADIYALGVMIWEMVAGRRFLQGDAVEHQAQVAHGNRPLSPLAETVGCPSALDDVLGKATANRVEDRYPTARVLLSDLVQVLKGAPSMADGDRSVRGRIAHLMGKLYPAEPARSRADFARRVAHARETLAGDGKVPSTAPGFPEPSPAPPSEMEEEAEGILGGTRYRLTRCISRGGMGEVWEAVHVDLGRTVALKLMPEAASQSGDARQKFRSEARALARLDHPGLVDVHDFGVTSQGRCYYGMELLRGQTLEQRLEKGPIGWREAVRLACEAAEALGAAHAAGIVHRDITPSNLFLTEDGVLKLLDFGVSRTQERADHESVGAPIVVGTPEYISPEQAAGGHADKRSDIYALGVVLYEMLTGRVPHQLGEAGSPTLPALLTAKISVTPLAPTLVAKERGIPKALDKITLRMLHRDADKRTPSTAAVLSALRPLEQRLLDKPRSYRVAALSAAATFLFVSALGYVNSRDEPAPPQVKTVDLDTLVEEVKEQEAQAAIEEAAPAEEAQVEAAPAEDPFQQEVERILAVYKNGSKINAHHQMKRLAEGAPQSIAVARGIVTTAQGVEAWGEAYTAAEMWLQKTQDPEAGLVFARLQKATLRGNPVDTLKEVLKAHPDFVPAQELLTKYEGKKVATR